MDKNKPLSIFSAAYWKEAAGQFAKVKMLTLAAVLIALRVAVDALSIPLGADLYIAVSFLVTALGACVYGPVMAMVCGGVTDTISAVYFPKGAYFFPFIFVEILAGLLFALVLWRRRVTPTRVVVSKFLVTVLCNVIINSAVLLWMYAWLGNPKTSLAFMVPRLVKNLVLFPAECFMLAAFLAAALPLLHRLHLYQAAHGAQLKLKPAHYILMAVLLVVAIGAVLLYFFW